MFTKPLQGAAFKNAAACFVGCKLQPQTESVFMFSINITDEPQGELKLAPPPAYVPALSSDDKLRQHLGGVHHMQRARFLLVRR